MPDKRGKKRFFPTIAYLFVFILTLAWIAGCASSSPREDQAAMSGGGAWPAESPEMSMDMAAPEFTGLEVRSEVKSIAYNEEASAPYAAAGTAAEAGSQRRYMVQRSYLTLEIADLEEAAETIKVGVEQIGGYLASRNFYDLGRERRRGEISLRVPAEKYSQVMLWLQEQGEVRNLEESAEDVTRQYIDLEARIGNLAAQEQRIRELLEKARDIEDILQIEKELTRIRGDLESMQGEFKYLRERVTFSSIDISLVEKDPRESAVTGEFDTFGKELSKRFALNTNRAIKGLTGLALSFLSSLPLLIPLAAAVLILWKLALIISRKGRKQQLSVKGKTKADAPKDIDTEL